MEALQLERPFSTVIESKLKKHVYDMSFHIYTQRSGLAYIDVEHII